MIILIIIAAILLCYLLFLVRTSGRKIKNELLVDYAHRGLHGGEIPENSLAAFKKAAEKGFGIELDVQLSRDGEVMVFHDYTLSRMTSDERSLADLSLDELKALRLNGTNEEIPTLREVLAVVDGRVPILVELKGEDFKCDLCPKVDEILSSYSGAYCVESFNPILISWYRKRRPEISRGILTTSLCRERKITPMNFVLDVMALNFLARPDFVAYDLHYPNRLAIWICKKLWRAVPFIWTPRNEAEYTEAKKSANAIFEGLDL